MNNRITFTPVETETEPIVLTDANFYGGVQYKVTSNADDDLQVGTVCSAQITFSITGDSTEINNLIGRECIYEVQQLEEIDFKQVGIFIVRDVQKTKTRYELTAYDRISKLDDNIGPWLNDIQFPQLTSELLSSICQHFNIQLLNTNFVNNNFVIETNFSTNNISGRTVAQYLAQIAGGFIKATSDGQVKVCYYEDSDIELTNSEYVSLQYADYTVPVIDYVRVAKYDDDIGYHKGTGTNALNIIGNSAFNNTSDLAMQTATDNIYNKVHTYSYVPTTIKLLNDNGIEVGDIITVDEITTMVMSKSWGPQGIELESTGNYERTMFSTNNSEIAQLDGKFNRLRIELEETQSQVGQIGVSVSTLTQRADEIETRVENAEDEISIIDQKADSITLRVEAAEDSIEDIVEGELPDIRRTIAEIDLDVDGITLSVTDSVGEEGAKVQLKKNDIVISSADITLTGNVILRGDLSTSGATIINGDNISTGSISFNRMRGGQLTLGGENDGDGTLIINNYRGDMIGTIDRYGLSIGDDFSVRLNSYGDMMTVLGGFKVYTTSGGSKYLATLDESVGIGNNRYYQIWAGDPVSPEFRVDSLGNVVATDIALSGEFYQGKTLTQFLQTFQPSTVAVFG